MDNNKLKIWHISDTHVLHDKLIMPKDIDLVIHTGDASNQRDPFRNEAEVMSFLEWYSELPIEHKVFCAGNHDTSIEKGLIKKDLMEEMGITYLYCDSTEIKGLKIWGAPYVPTYGDWAFMKARGKIYMVWDQIPEDTDILITHGPPKGILDLTYRRDNAVDVCGDSSLLKRVMKLDLKLMCFGHIHNCKDLTNAGIKKIFGKETIFSNGSCVTDGKWGQLSSHGNEVYLPLR